MNSLEPNGKREIISIDDENNDAAKLYWSPCAVSGHPLATTSATNAIPCFHGAEIFTSLYSPQSLSLYPLPSLSLSGVNNGSIVLITDTQSLLYCLDLTNELH